LITRVFPEDVNRRQKFDLSLKAESANEPGIKEVDQIKLVFEESSDFFGRITVYDISLDGYQVESW
jgi:hypothetical protein